MRCVAHFHPILTPIHRRYHDFVVKLQTKSGLTSILASNDEVAPQCGVGSKGQVGICSELR